ncbi:MAG: bifunctional riboflavin kinase/FAD synthetase [Clostridia bacterium]|nr:bifunctional riboflavin kinase/FAD synthetase [Clostridia bacterium]
MQKNSYCIALGFFDCMHLGHQAIFRSAIEFAQKNAMEVAVFTFSENANKSGGRQLYSFEERVKLYEQYGVKTVIAYPFNEETKKKSGEEFLNELTEKYNAKAFCCGEDYRFGNGAKCDVEFLKEYCKKRKLTLIVVPDEKIDGVKVSSTDVKALLFSGKIEKANELLGKPYFIDGKVVTGRGEGHIFGFPTANISESGEGIALPHGVYGCYIEIDGTVYKAVTNVGQKPTFGDLTPTIESFIVGYDGNAYGKTVSLSFIKYLRPTVKFDTPERLREQIYADAKWEE